MEFYPYTMKCKRNVVDKGVKGYLSAIIDPTTNPPAPIVYDNYFIRSITGLYQIELVSEFNNDASDKQMLKPTESGLNYVYVPKFGRYYFVDDIYFDNAMRMTLKCTCDVLYTYKGLITGATQIVTRQANEYNGLYPDSKFPILAKKKLIPINIGGSPFSSNDMASGKKCIVLTVNGGV